MIEKLLESSEKSASILQQIRSAPAGQLTEHSASALLLEAICYKLMIPKTDDHNIRHMIIMSIKRQDLSSSALSDTMIEKQIRQYDCHQTNLVAQKKVLLFFFIENKLGIHLNDDEAAEITTTDDLARAVIRHRKEGVENASQ